MSDPCPVDFRVVIPARFGSSRLPGKPLLPLAGKPLVLHVLERARAAGALEVVVATDDPRIVAVVREAGGEVELTRADHPSGTDRIAEVAERRGWGSDDIVVNVQGDEPLIPSGLVRQLAMALHGRSDLHMATVATPLRESAELVAANVVKVVTRADGRALYFSRAPIPWVRDSFHWGDAALPLSTVAPPLRHIGLYAYRVATLQHLTTSAVSPMEAVESLEQLRALWLGLEIQVLTVAEAPTHGVDTPADLERVRQILEAGGA